LQSSASPPFLLALGVLAALKVQPPGLRVSPISALIDAFAAGIVLVAHWCHVHPRCPRLIGSQQIAVRVKPGAQLSCRQLIHTVSRNLNNHSRPWYDRYDRPSDALLSRTPPEPIDRPVEEMWPCEMGCSQGAWMHACSLNHGYHSPGRHSAARKRHCSRTKTCKWAPRPSDQSAQSTCMQAWRQSNGVRLTTASTMSTVVDACCPITTLIVGSETPHALRNTSRGRVRASGQQKPHYRRIRVTERLGYTKDVTQTVNYNQHYRSSQVKRHIFTKQQRPVRSSHPC
jgi:hypothetical protein